MCFYRFYRAATSTWQRSFPTRSFQPASSSSLLTIFELKEIDGGVVCGQLSAPPLTFYPSIQPSVSRSIHSFHRCSHSHLEKKKRKSVAFLDQESRVAGVCNRKKETHIPSQRGILFSSFFRFSVCISPRPPRRAPPDRKSISPLKTKKRKQNKRHSLLFYRQVIYK